MDNLKEIAMYLTIWIIVSVVTTIFWNEFVGDNDDNNWPKP
jgi:uncharacterized membrane protein